MSGTTVAVSGTSYAERSVSVAERVDALYRKDRRSTVLDLAGQSDLLAGLSGIELFDVVTAYGDARRAAGATFVVEFTITPWELYSAAEDRQRLAYNALLVANVGNQIDLVIDLAGRSEFANAANSFYLVGGHPTLAAVTVIATLASRGVSRLWADRSA